MYEIEILLIDDNPADIEIARETFNQNKLNNNLNIVSTGAEVMAFLRREIQVPQPDLILLDSAFNQNTQAVFDAIKQDENLRDVPLFMMTPAGTKLSLPEYKLPPNGFVNKPFNFLQFINVIKTVKTFKVAIVTTH
jgi:CheY-like chemotaxis protein